MSALDFAFAFSAIVQLIGQFKQDRGQRAAGDDKAFMEWLATNQREDVIRYLQQNSGTLIGIKIALSQNQDVLVAMLGEIDRKVAMLAGSTILLQPLAAAIYPDSQVSAEALEFLREFEKTGSAEAMDFAMLAEVWPLF